jgi:hypothetical protein
MEDKIDPRWRKSSYSGNGGGSCIEVADQAARVLVRDTQDRTGPVLQFSSAAWRKFASGVKADASLSRPARGTLRRGCPFCCAVTFCGSDALRIPAGCDLRSSWMLASASLFGRRYSIRAA